MRRSRSFSNIPLLKTRRNISSENLVPQQGVRTSQQGVRTSHQGLRRSISSNNLLSVPKSLYAVESRNDFPASTNKNANRRITGTPLRPIGNSSVCRRITATPSSQCKVAPSPCTAAPLTTNLINDKKFSSDQFRKICAFMEAKVEDFDPKSIKPLSLNSFVLTMSLLFGEIDPRIKINMQNYKEVVFKYLKLFKYPGPVSMSLLKSVNTKLSWTQVMSIFGWLVDLINEMKWSPDENLLETYILYRAKDTCLTGNESEGLFIEYIEQLLNFDKDGAEMIENEVALLSQEAENKRKLTNEKKEENTILSKTLEQMKSDIKEFKENNFETEIKNETNKLQLEYKMRVTEIEDIMQSIAEIQQIISTQKYSLKDKKDLLNKLEDQKYSLALRNEEIQNMLKLKDDYDYKQTDYRRQIETKIHEMNGRLLQLNHAKKIRLPDRFVDRPKFIEEIEEKKQTLINISKTIDLEFDQLQETLSTKKNQYKLLCVDVEKINNDNEALKKEIAKIDVEISRVTFEFDACKKQQEIKIKNLMETAPDVESIKRKNLKLQEEILNLRENNYVLGEQIIELCKEIYEDTVKKATQMNAIMVDLTGKALSAYEKIVKQKQGIVSLLNENVDL